MSWIGVMVGVGVGAGSSGLMTGLNGGSTEDILKSMAIGGAMGGAGGGIGTALSGPAAGAVAGSTSGAVTGGTTGAVTGGTTGAVTGGTTGAVTGGTTGAVTGGTTGAVTGGTTGAVTGGGTGGAGFAGLNGGTSIVSGAANAANPGSVLASQVANASNAALPTATGGIGNLAAASSAVNPSSVLSSQAGNAANSVLPTAGDIAAETTAYNSANMGTQLLSDAFGTNVAGNTGLKMAGSALQGGVINAGISGLMAGAKGEDVGEAMGKGAATGMIGGAATSSLSGMDNAVGRFATEHPYITSGGIGLAANMALDKPYEDTAPPTQPGIRSNVKWNPSVYRPYGPQFAAGGITDLDNYDQTPQMQNPGTLDIPNRNEVANNQGYMGDSVQMMAHGGVAEESYMLEGVGGRNLHREASRDLRDYLEDTPDTELTPEQRKQKQILFAKKMAMGGMAYAHGGISDLGGYSDGGRLLKGPGTGVSDDIPATIEGRQPARLAANEFVVPARIVSEIGNGSTDAGAKALYAMMDRVQKDRSKSMGKGKFAVDSKASRHLDSL